MISKMAIAIGGLSLGVLGFMGNDHLKSKNSLEQDWPRQNIPVVGTILAESYQDTLVPNPEFDGAVSYSNETIKLE
jgi:hypothetical protein